MTQAHKDAVDALLEERNRAISRLGSTEGTLGRAEFYLNRCLKLLASAIMPSAHLSAHRDTLVDEVIEFLAESDRIHPLYPEDLSWPQDVAVLGGDDEGAAPPSGDTTGHSGSAY